MKYLASLLLAGVAFFASAQEGEQEETPMTGAKIAFTEKSYNFGDITQGDKVEYTFAFENTGNEPLILSDVRTTCGCTAPEWPKEPIAPGAKAELRVVFNSAGKMGMQNKVITVMSNAANSPERVKIVTNVMPPDNN